MYIHTAEQQFEGVCLGTFSSWDTETPNPSNNNSPFLPPRPPPPCPQPLEITSLLLCLYDFDQGF